MTSLNRFNRLDELRKHNPSFEERDGPIENSTYIALCNRRLHSLPTGLFDLCRLIELNLWKNDLLSLPSSVSRLTNLALLSLYENRLSSLPHEISRLTNITWLSISSNRFSFVPAGISALTGLTYLSLYSNLIKELPPGITCLTNLRQLCLHDARGIKSVVKAPQGITTLPCWYTVSDEENGYTIADVPQLFQIYEDFNDRLMKEDWIPSESQILSQSLSSFGMNLVSFPLSITRLTNLTYLNIGQNKISVLPEAISNLSYLKDLCIWRNMISKLPSLRSMASLRTLNLQQNAFILESQRLLDSMHITADEIGFVGQELQELTTELLQLPMKSFLNLSRNQIKDIPDWITEMTWLTHLDISQNRIFNFPLSICNIKSLRNVCLSQNKLTSIPDAITCLQSLQYLNISGNRILDFELTVVETEYSIDGKQ